MKKSLLAAVLVMAEVGFATPVVSGVTAKQRYPWNGLVDINYEIVGSTNGIDGVDGLLIAIDRQSGNSHVATSFVEPLDLSEGSHHAVWNLSADDQFASSDVVCRVMIRQMPPYVVIDLSGGATAKSYPVDYLYALPQDGWSDEYKTTKLVMKLVGPGLFKMGASYDVRLTDSYYMGIFEVTQEQWELVMGSNPSVFSGSMRPVENVSYDMIRGSNAGGGWPAHTAVDADSFLGRLRARTGLPFDLPTEAQWEYACMAGTTSSYSYGGSFNSDYTWWIGNSSQTHDVGTRRENPWGFYDMYGNVAEWCLDWYGSIVGGVNPKGADSGSLRVMRGGSWGNGSYDDFTSYSRSSYNHSNGDKHRGFRIAMIGGGNEVSSAESASITVDSRTGIKYAEQSRANYRLSYDPRWIGADEKAEVVIKDNGVEIFRKQGHGEIEWSVPDYDTVHVLTHVVIVDGVAQEEVYSAQFVAVNCEGMGLPGLQRVTFTGSAYDASNVALGAEPIVTLNGEGMYDASLGAQSTYAYAGYMYFHADETYTFRGNFDDYSSVRVDNAEVVAQHTGDNSGSIGPFAESGWHKVDFRVSNNGGASGGGFGIQYQTDKDTTWHKIEDDGSGTCLRTGPDYCGVVILKAAMRPSDPTIMDVVYKVQSPKEKVSVRALAYENGNRSFANAVPVLTFADGTGVNIGDDIAANEEHTLSWQVAADWATDLTKVRFEVMVMDEGLLPLHFVTIPKTANHAAIQYSDTVLSSTAVMNALFWLYAGLDDDLSLSNGRLSGPFGELANGANVSNPAQTVSWLYQKMGYSTLTGANLNYVNSAARINLAPDGLRQFAVKTIK